MNNKGESSVGIMVVLAIAIIVGAVLLQPIFANQATMTQTYSENKTEQAIPTEITALTGQELIGTAVVVNQSGAVDCSANYTISEAVYAPTNTKRIVITPAATNSLCTVLNYSYIYGAEGYVDDVGGRALAGNIGLFAALALLAAVIFYFVKSNGWLGL